MLWSRHFRRCLAASPAVADGVVYQAVMHELPCPKGNRSARGFVVAMDARTGKELWRFRSGVVESSPLLVDGRLYFGSWDHYLYAVRARDGRSLWRYRADDEVNSAPAYAGGTIYFGTDGGRVHAVDARTGRARWVASAFSRFGRREYFYATPTVAYGRVYIGNTDGTVYAFGAGSGRMLWARRAGTYVYTAAAVWRRRVFVGTYDGRVFALDAATGDVRWSSEAPAAVHGAPTVLDGLVYFSSCGTCGSNGQRYAKSGPFSTFAVDARTGKRVLDLPGRALLADRHRPQARLPRGLDPRLRLVPAPSSPRGEQGGQDDGAERPDEVGVLQHAAEPEEHEDRRPRGPRPPARPPATAPVATRARRSAAPTRARRAARTGSRRSARRARPRRGCRRARSR